MTKIPHTTTSHSKNSAHTFTLFLLILMSASLFIFACGRKEAPLPQKINHLYAFQDVYVYLDPTGTLTVMGTITGARNNVQGLNLEIEGFDESCPTCPFVPVESFVIDPREMWDNQVPQNFSFTVMPTRQSVSYRWRLTGYNIIAGLPDVRTPVLQVQAE